MDAYTFVSKKISCSTFESIVPLNIYDYRFNLSPKLKHFFLKNFHYAICEFSLEFSD